MKKTLLILFTLLFLLFASTALAEWDESRTYEYTLNADGTATLISTGFLGSDEGPVQLPDKLGGCPLTAIGDYALKGKTCEQLIIPETVVSIGDYAFQNCYSLLSITIPGTVKTMGDGVFDGCFDLVEATFEDGNITIGSNPFSGCNDLETVTVSDTHPTLKLVDNVLFTKDGARLLSFICCANEDVEEYEVPNGVVEIAGGAFQSNNDLEEVTLPESLKRIGDYAFMECYYLEEINIPSGLSYLGDGAFMGCRYLEEIFLPASLTEIKGNPFSQCKGLESVELEAGNPVYAIWNDALVHTPSATLICRFAYADSDYQVPDGIVTLENNALYAQEITSVSLPASLTHIGNNALAENPFAAVILPQGLQEIGEAAFKRCTNLREISIPAGVTKIGNNAFDGCSAIHKAVIMGGEIGKYAFRGCKQMESLDVKAGVTKIGPYAFDGCISLPVLTVPGTVKTVGENAFNGCSALAQVVFEEGVESIGAYAFYYCYNMRMTLPASLTNIDYSAFRSANNVLYTVPQGSQAEKHMKEKGFIYGYPGQELSFPEAPGAMKTVDEVKAFLAQKAANLETNFEFHCSAELTKLLLTNSRSNDVSIAGYELFQSLLADAGIQRFALKYNASEGFFQVECLYWQGYRLAKLHASGDLSSLTHQEKQALDIALQIANDAKARAASPLEMERIINDEICRRLHYPSFYISFSFGLFAKLEAPGKEESVVTILTGETGEADCEGYSDTFYLIATLAGLDVKYMIGTIDGGGHAWNAIRLNDQWHFLDVTSNDYNQRFYTGDIVNYYCYFNIGQDKARPQFAWEDRYASLEIAPVTDPSLYFYTSPMGGGLFTDAAALTAFLRARYDAGERVIQALVDTQAIPMDSVVNILRNEFANQGISLQYVHAQLQEGTLIMLDF